MIHKFHQSDLNLFLLIPDDKLNFIKLKIEEYLPNEFGGVFVGRYNNAFDTLEIVDVVLPKKFRNSRYLFLRYPYSINKQIKKIFKETEGKVIYVGEWHSHPNGSTTPSITDFETIMKISNYKKVNIENPLLMISSFISSKFVFEIYIFYKNNLYKYEKV